MLTTFSSLNFPAGKKNKRIKIVTPQQQFNKKTKIVEEVKNGNQKIEKKTTSIKVNGSSIDEGRKMFEWLITPQPVAEFMK